jgi:hypothetical protein
MYRVPVTVASKKNGPYIPLEDIPHRTDVLGKLNARYSVTFGFAVAQNTHLYRLIEPLGLKVALLDQVMISGNDSLPSHSAKMPLSIIHWCLWWSF